MGLPSIVINGMPFERAPETRYLHDYHKVAANIESGRWNELEAYRSLVLEDLWFIVYFILQVPIANHPFVVQACRDVQFGPQTNTLDLWAREHFKSTIITTAETIQRLLKDPNERICIFSYTRPAALSFFRSIKHTLESSELLRKCFTDIIYDKPGTEAPRWSEDGGLYVKRSGFPKEASLEAWGMIEGMPVGRHYTGRIYDDVVTQDLVNTPEMMQKVKDAFDMSQNLGVEGGWQRVIGTTYHHDDALIYIKNKIDPVTNKPIYHARIKPATHDGTPSGRSVLLSEKRLAELRTNVQMFYSQQLLNPTPRGTQTLDPEQLIMVRPNEIPKRLYKFMTIDPAGSNIAKRRGDSWSIMLIGIAPFRDDYGASDLYILDMVTDPVTQVEALEHIVNMYMKGGRVIKVGVEKIGISTAEIHVANALRSKGKNISIEAGNLEILQPRGRKKDRRIESNLMWPLNNGKIHISAAIAPAYIERLKIEMERFPHWHDDALDALSYVYDLIKEYRFPVQALEEEEDAWERAFRKHQEAFGSENSWMYV
jgi:hypothetical protein